MFRDVHNRQAVVPRKEVVLRQSILQEQNDQLNASIRQQLKSQYHKRTKTLSPRAKSNLGQTKTESTLIPNQSRKSQPKQDFK